MTTITVGLVGKRAGDFVAGITSLPGARVTAVCDPDASARARLAARAGVDAASQFASYDDLLERARPDAVILGSPMPYHAPQAVQALDAGVHVLSEVTAAVDLDQCHALVQAVQRAATGSGAHYMMAENYCYRRDVVLVRELARQGRFGRLYYAEGEYLHDVKQLHHQPDGQPSWRATWQVGKRGCTYGTHSLGPALEFFGPDTRVATVTCLGSGTYTDPEHPHDDTCIMLCQLTTGGLIRIRLDMLSNRPHAMAYYALQGTRGCYEGARGLGDTPAIWLGTSAPDPQERRRWQPLWDYQDALPEGWRQLEQAAASSGHGGGDFYVVRDFLAAVVAGRQPPIDVYRALDYTVPGLISEQSIAQGGIPLPVPDFRPVGPHRPARRAPGRATT